MNKQAMWMMMMVAPALASAAAQPDLLVYAGKPLAGYHVTVADFEAQAQLGKQRTVVPKPAQPRVPESSVSAAPAGKGLTLEWNKAWYSSLRIEGGKPVDLRPYAANGVLALDVKVDDLADGGMSFKINCGKDCERQVPYLIPGRALAGKGWQHLVFSMSCFVRDGDDFSAVGQPFVLDGSGTGRVSVASVKFQAGGKPNAACPDYKTVSVTPDMLNESWSIPWWLPRHLAKLEEVKQLRKNQLKSEIVFIGDSITQGWEKEGAPVWDRYYKKYHALDLGFGGDRTENVLWRLQHGEVDGIQPKVAVLMLGTNNTGNRQEDPMTTAAGIRRNIEEIQRRLPDTRILLLAVFPRGEKADDAGRQINERLNKILAGFADDKKITFLNINQQFLQADGTLSRDIMPDLLHPNEKGYEIWAEAMAPTLQKLLGEGYSWGNVAMGGTGFVSGLVTSKTEPGLVYARTDVGGAYRWDQRLARWVALTDWVSDSETGLLGIEAIALDPSAPAKVYMLAGTSYHNGGKTAILKSDDYGRSFTKIDVSQQFKAHGNGMGRNTGEKLQVDPADGKVLYVGTRANGMFKSVDAGLSWQHLDALKVGATPPNDNGISFVLLDPASVAAGATQRLFLGVTRGGKENIYMSADAGKSFRALPGGPSTLMPQRAVLAGGNLVITYANGAGPWGRSGMEEAMDQGQVWKYHVASGQWTNISPKLNRAFAGISADPRDPLHMVISTINYYPTEQTRGDKILVTRDGGANWNDIFERGYALDDNGVDWVNTSFIHWTASVEFDPFDTRKLRVVSGNGIFKTADIDATPVKWTFDVHGLEESVPLNLISIPGGPLISAIGDYDGFVHTDVTRYVTIHKPAMGTTTGLAFAAADPRVVARVGSAIYLSTDMGRSWSKSASHNGSNGSNGQLALSADGKALLHSPEKSDTSYRSTDAGNSWQVVKGLNVKGARPVADTVNPNRMYALDGARMLVSSDAGASFAAAGSLPVAHGSRLVRAVPGREGDVWVPLYDGGLARSTDSGATFATLAKVSYAAAVGFGKAAAGAQYPTVYLWGSVDGVRGLFCSRDSGANWRRINDDAHQYGGPGDGQFVVGDMNQAGVVYMSTAGRGIVYGKPEGSSGPCQ
ncbi:MAG: GDSL-type esterase/lipase family protein [Sphingomonadaceae bacterium]